MLVRAASLHPFVLEAMRNVVSTPIENGHMDSKVNCSLRSCSVGRVIHLRLQLTACQDVESVDT